MNPWLNVSHRVATNEVSYGKWQLFWRKIDEFDCLICKKSSGVMWRASECRGRTLDKQSCGCCARTLPCHLSSLRSSMPSACRKRIINTGGGGSRKLDTMLKPPRGIWERGGVGRGGGVKGVFCCVGASLV